jgi:hypothetical protein
MVEKYPDKKLDLIGDNRTYTELVKKVDSGKTKVSKVYRLIKRDQEHERIRAENRAKAEELERSGVFTTIKIPNGYAIRFNHPRPPYTPPPEPTTPELLRSQEIEQELMDDGELQNIMKIEYVYNNERDGTYEVHQSQLDMNTMEKLIKLCKKLGMNFIIKPFRAFEPGLVLTVKFWKKEEKTLLSGR